MVEKFKNLKNFFLRTLDEKFIQFSISYQPKLTILLDLQKLIKMHVLTKYVFIGFFWSKN